LFVQSPETSVVRVSRRAFAVVSAVLVALAVAGSLSPFDVRPMPFAEALRIFAHVQFVPLGRISTIDLISNVLLFAPLGFAFAGMLDDRRRHAPIARLLQVAPAVALAIVLSTSIEFCQMFFPSRIAAGSDIVFDTFGAALGVIAWMEAGRALTASVERVLEARERPDALVRCLCAYAIAFCVFQIYPFDVTISPGDLSQKYHAGRVALTSLADVDQVHVVTMTALALPLGALSAVGWRPKRGRRSLLPAIAVGALLAVCTEGAQLFIFSRSTYAADVIALVAGIAGGAISVSSLL
jgi:VanZ family protein